jgi:NTE family protein
MKQYFDAVNWTRDVVGASLRDARFVADARRALLPLPFEGASVPDGHPFPVFRAQPLAQLRGRRLAFVSTGGSGALAAVVGCARAWEEAGVTPVLMSLCSGSALFGFPIAAGLSSEEVAEFSLSLRPEDTMDTDWAGIARIAVGGRGFTGLLRGEVLEQTYRRLLGDMRLGDLRIPCYAPIWNVETDSLEYMGPQTYPDLPVAAAIRTAVALPLFYQPARMDGSSWADGGIVDIFPVRPVLDLAEPPDLALAVNCFYPPGFAGEEVWGWERRMASIVHAAAQVRYAQQIEMARVNLRLLQERCEVLMTEPVPYAAVRGAGFYRQYFDHSEWPDFMRRGRDTARRALRSWRPAHTGARVRPAA